MKNVITLMVIVSYAVIGNTQITDLPLMDKYVTFSEGKYKYDDTVSINKIRDNGKPFISYLTVNDTIIREEYFENGRIKSRSQIIQTIATDTIVNFNTYTKEYKVQKSKRLLDIPNGSYIEYYNTNKENNVKSTGHCENTKRIGEWIFIDRLGNKIIANFNFEGEFEGNYKEFYYNKRNDTYSLKIEGQFGKRTYEVSDQSYKKEEIKNSEKIEIRRIGKWKYYSTEGKLLEFVEYSWNKN